MPYDFFDTPTSFYYSASSLSLNAWTITGRMISLGFFFLNGWFFFLYILPPHKLGLVFYHLDFIAWSFLYDMAYEPLGKHKKRVSYFGQLGFLGNAGMRYGIHGFKPTSPLLPHFFFFFFFFGGKYLTPYPLLST